MKPASFLPILLLPVIPMLMFLRFVLVPRRRMKQRARELLTEQPNAEHTSVYLPFQSGWTGKQLELDAKIAEMAKTGWTFLRASEANPLRTLQSPGGGLTLHFIRSQPRG